MAGNDGHGPDPLNRAGPAWLSYVRLARPHQWAKGVFVLIGPMYGLADGESIAWLGVVGAFLAFGLAASSSYVINDIRDREQDRAHPRKRSRPIASGAVSVGRACWYAAGLMALAAAALLLIPAGDGGGGWGPRALTGAVAGAYVLNVSAYSLALKHVVIVDVMCLSLGFVLRVLGGCAAAGVEPSTWLLNCTFFLAMFLAFGKRLGERRMLADRHGAAEAARIVHARYTEDLLRMVVVVTAVASLVTYAGYVQSQESGYTIGFNLLWLTIIPATFGVFRALLLLERGEYDDPTVLAANDRPFQIGAALFAGITVLLVLGTHDGWFGGA